MPARPMNFDKQDINILAVNNVDRIPGLMVRHDLNELNAEGGLEETLNMVPVYTTILPAGTLLFRGLREPEQVFDDYLGQPTPYARSYCLTNLYNVFFYPFPFVDETVQDYEVMAVYVLAQDVEVGCYISPSPLSRGDRQLDGHPIVPCDQINGTGCLSTEGHAYDPCFRDTFIEAHPTVTGIIAIAGGDRNSLVRQLKTEVASADLKGAVNRYFSFYRDSHSMAPGVPEIILFPRRKRLPDYNQEIKTMFSEFGDFPLGDYPQHEHVPHLTSWVKNQVDDDGEPTFTYHLFSMIPRTEAGRIRDLIDTGMRKKDAGAGLTTQSYPMRIDPTTGFFVSLKYYRGDPSKLIADPNRLGERFPEMKFKRGVYPTAKLKAGVAASLSGRLPAAAPAPAGPAAAGAGPAPPAGGNRRRTRRKNTRA